MLWKIITSYPEFEISEYGDVRRIGTTKCRKLQDKGGGYMVVQFRKKGTKPKNESIQRLVATAFHGDPPSDKHEAAHNDGNPSNNHYMNLRWATRKQNEADKLRHGTDSSGERNPRAKFTEEDIRAIRADNRPRSQIAAHYGTPGTYISDIRARRAWRSIV